MPSGKAKRKFQEQQTRIKERWKSTYVWALEQTSEHLNEILSGAIKYMVNYKAAQIDEDTIQWIGASGVSNTDKDAIQVALKKLNAK
jgi:hypothetical protein